MIQRLITGFFLLTIGLFMIYFGGPYLWVFAFAIGVGCIYELSEMFKRRGILLYTPLIYLVFMGIMIGLLNGLLIPYLYWPVTVLCVLGLIAVYHLELIFHKIIVFENRILSTVRVMLFSIGTFPFIYLLREGERGIYHFAFAYLVIWSVDIFALFGGRIFGKTPLSKVSPKKTVEGSLVGMGVALLSTYLFVLYFQLPIVAYLSLALVISVVAQAGDLHESLFKRYFQVKDSSSLLPGHGGVYDRSDSSLFVAPILFYLFHFLL